MDENDEGSGKAVVKSRGEVSIDQMWGEGLVGSVDRLYR